MKHSEHHIITTHVGSLPRTERLDSMLVARDHDKNVDQADFETEIDNALDYVVRRQLESGVDVGSDGEQPRVSYMTYIPKRMSGFSGASNRIAPDHVLMDRGRYRSRSGHVRTSALTISVENDPNQTLGDPIHSIVSLACHQRE